ncbi:Holliday junction resolvase RuvX [Pleionea sp. CnH1-48]|uniref:Holliday junction resolvase RuvX n=1 Tax=Pleionea sp. CnH1-48 TaxID=2954494 RepID=UPI002098378A|nr:Holliday junction resolvase RuvX [Pleionea sp. CnH1-48]MCO7225260.1 Holliday junction resolvase RuvX [Pleionea sp. CnH1-48]
MTKPQTLLSFDFGERSIGVAFGQAITGSARPLNALKANNGQPNWDQVAALLKEWKPDALVVGCPLNMDGTEQELTLRARKFAKRLHGRFGLKVYEMDERLSTVEARSRLFDEGGYRSLEKGRIDSESAVIIMESWFSYGDDTPAY